MRVPPRLAPARGRGAAGDPRARTPAAQYVPGRDRPGGSLSLGDSSRVRAFGPPFPARWRRRRRTTDAERAALAAAYAAMADDEEYWAEVLAVEQEFARSDWEVSQLGEGD